MSDLPNDSDGDAIRLVIKDGADLSRPMEIDFHVAAPSAGIAEKVAEQANLCGFQARVVKDEGDGNYPTWCSKTMLLTYQAVIGAQTQLSELSIPLGAYSDGWGTFGNRE